MRAALLGAIGTAAIMSVAVAAQGAKPSHLNPMIELHAQSKPLFGLYAPANRGAGRRGADPATPIPPQKTPAELVKDAFAYDRSDFLFNGNMEGGVDRGIAPFTDFVTAAIDT